MVFFAVIYFSVVFVRCFCTMRSVGGVVAGVLGRLLVVGVRFLLRLFRLLRRSSVLRGRRLQMC